jgi:hypothetical protein
MGHIYASAVRVLIWIRKDELGIAEQSFALIQDTNATLMDLFSRYGDVANIPLISTKSKVICSDSSKWDNVRRLMDSE